MRFLLYSAAFFLLGADATETAMATKSRSASSAGRDWACIGDWVGTHASNCEKEDAPDPDFCYTATVNPQDEVRCSCHKEAELKRKYNHPSSVQCQCLDQHWSCQHPEERRRFLEISQRGFPGLPHPDEAAWERARLVEYCDEPKGDADLCNLAVEFFLMTMGTMEMTHDSLDVYLQVRQRQQIPERIEKKLDAFEVHNCALQKTILDAAKTLDKDWSPEFLARHFDHGLHCTTFKAAYEEGAKIDGPLSDFEKTQLQAELETAKTLQLETLWHVYGGDQPADLAAYLRANGVSSHDLERYGLARGV